MTKALAAAAAVLAAFPLFLILLVTASTGTPAQAAPAATGLTGTPTALAMSGIPADYLAWYMAAAKTCPGLPWSVLAGIGEVESDHGRSTLPGIRSGSNSAGAEGPMQFEPATFGQFAVNADPGQPLSPYDPADAIYTAAAMLCASGARGGSPAGLQNAVFAYNHAQWYVSEVMAWAAKYATQGGSHVVATAIAFAGPSSASRTSGARPGRTPTTAPAWSTPPTPPPASTSPAPPTSGSKTAPSSRCPRSSPATCCSARAATAPRPTPATSSCTSATARSSRQNKPANPSRPTRSTWRASSWPPAPQTWQASHDQHRPVPTQPRRNPDARRALTCAEPAARPAAAAQALRDAASAVAAAWEQPMDPDAYSRAVSQLYSVLRDLGIAIRGLARYQVIPVPPGPADRGFAQHATTSAAWLLGAWHSLDGVVAAEGLGPLPDPPAPGTCYARRHATRSPPGGSHQAPQPTATASPGSSSPRSSTSPRQPSAWRATRPGTAPSTCTRSAPAWPRHGSRWPAPSRSRPARPSGTAARPPPATPEAGNERRPDHQRAARRTRLPATERGVADGVRGEGRGSSLDSARPARRRP